MTPLGGGTILSQVLYIRYPAYSDIYTIIHDSYEVETK